MERKQLTPVLSKGYFSDDEAVQYFSSGCTMLDCVLGGGWAVGRVSNIVGDKSSGKTLLAIEAVANFLGLYPKGKVYYAETEGAFDKEYAIALGVPIQEVEFVPCFTVEELHDSLTKVVDRYDERKQGGDPVGGGPYLYIVDSLDALTTNEELKRALDAQTYGTEKARQMSQLFRRLVKPLREREVTVVVISQVRDNIGVTFGKKSVRTGGRALDFYASQILWLTHTKRLKQTKKGVERSIGVRIKAKCEKNKVGLPFRECEFPIYFQFGIEDVVAGVEWLKEVGELDELGEERSIISSLKTMNTEQYHTFRMKVARVVKEAWAEVEARFRPERKKY